MNNNIRYTQVYEERRLTVIVSLLLHMISHLCIFNEHYLTHIYRYKRRRKRKKREEERRGKK